MALYSMGRYVQMVSTISSKVYQAKNTFLFDRLFYPQLSSNEETAMPVYTDVTKSESCSSAIPVSSSFTVTQSLQNMLGFLHFTVQVHIFLVV